jgi:hypothetical protein
MRCRPLPILLVLALAAGCKTTVPVVVKKGGTPAPAASVTPTAASPPATVPAMLQAPAGTRTLAGQVTIDARYAVDQAGARILSNNGSSVVALAGDALIANNAGNLVGSRQGGAAMATARGDLLAAGLVSDHGGGVISNNGSTLTAKTKRGLLDETAPAVGTQLPAAGLLVSAVSLKTHAYVPVGQDPAGQPVYSVFSDGAGAFKLYLPASEAGNVLVVANVPGTQDENLVYGGVTPVTATAKLDEDAQLATRLIRYVLGRHLARIISTPDTSKVVADIVSGDTALSGQVRPLLIDLIQRLNTHAHQAGVPADDTAVDRPEVRELGLLLADVALGQIDYQDLTTSSLFDPRWTGASENILVGIGVSMRALREATGKYMQRHLAAGESLPVEVRFPSFMVFFPDHSSCSYPASMKLRKPSDLGAFLISDVLARQTSGVILDTRKAFAGLAPVPLTAYDDPSDQNPDLYRDESGQQLSYGMRIEASMDALLGHFALATSPPDGTPSALLDATFKRMDDYAATHKFPGPAEPIPLLGTLTPCTAPGP